ncbi:MAG: family 43 glycosylhydrolase, partial [Chloroflexi bacterium]|nr:family 43 glycosylhydrolase [Chloroflexota bacterium]
MANSSIKPGQVWLDTSGNRIQAHGGSIFYENDTFYWYGENKEKTLPGSKIWHWGVRCYASHDLYNWEDQGLIIPPEPDNPASPLHPSRGMDRPHIIYNRSMLKYVCWLKIMESDGSQRSTILTADHLLGPYTLVRTGYQPYGMNAGDFDLVVDPSDGKAYYYFEKVHTELICAELTDDYTAVAEKYSSHFPRKYPPYVREAPAHFYRGGLHYLFTSGTTGYWPNPSEVACSEHYHGPFKVLGNPHVNDPSESSFRSQITSVFRHPYKKELYIALADRWLVDYPAA